MGQLGIIIPESAWPTSSMKLIEKPTHTRVHVHPHVCMYTHTSICMYVHIRALWNLKCYGLPKCYHLTSEIHMCLVASLEDRRRHDSFFWCTSHQLPPDPWGALPDHGHAPSVLKALPVCGCFMPMVYLACLTPWGGRYENLLLLMRLLDSVLRISPDRRRKSKR